MERRQMGMESSDRRREKEKQESKRSLEKEGRKTAPKWRERKHVR